jgi:hypothetical protein
MKAGANYVDQDRKRTQTEWLHWLYGEEIVCKLVVSQLCEWQERGFD